MHYHLKAVEEGYEEADKVEDRIDELDLGCISEASGGKLIRGCAQYPQPRSEGRKARST